MRRPTLFSRTTPSGCGSTQRSRRSTPLTRQLQLPLRARLSPKTGAVDHNQPVDVPGWMYTTGRRFWMQVLKMPETGSVLVWPVPDDDCLLPPMTRYVVESILCSGTCGQTFPSASLFCVAPILSCSLLQHFIMPHVLFLCVCSVAPTVCTGMFGLWQRVGC